MLSQKRIRLRPTVRSCHAVASRSKLRSADSIPRIAARRLELRPALSRVARARLTFSGSPALPASPASGGMLRRSVSACWLIRRRIATAFFRCEELSASRFSSSPSRSLAWVSSSRQRAASSRLGVAMYRRAASSASLDCRESSSRRSITSLVRARARALSSH